MIVLLSDIDLLTVIQIQIRMYAKLPAPYLVLLVSGFGVYFLAYIRRIDNLTAIAYWGSDLCETSWRKEHALGFDKTQVVSF